MKIKSAYRKAKSLINAWHQGEVKFINPALEDEFEELSKADKTLSVSIRLNRIGHMLDALSRLIVHVTAIEEAIVNKDVKL